MASILLYSLITIAIISLLFAPWISGIAYVINSLWQPQYIWPWVFEGVPIFRITAGIAIIGLFFSIAQSRVDPNIFKDRQNAMLLIIWLWMNLSHFLTSFPGEVVSVSPEIVLETMNAIFIMYFVLLLLLNHERAIKFLCYTFAIVGIYYTYWANSAYLNEEWFRFVNERLTGPPLSPYQDANVISTFIVMCLPFVILLYFYTKNRAFKVAIFLVTPLIWHAIVLFSSRAALLASFFSLLLVAYVVRSHKMKVILSVAFIGFLAYQGGTLVYRATQTVEMTQVRSEEPVNPRLVSWEAGLRLIPEYPFFGAGVQMFEAAARQHLPGMTPHVAHNTFLNFSVNSGLITGIMFLGLIYTAWRRLKLATESEHYLSDFNYYALLASSISLISFFICSIFLDLIIFEPFYICLIINIIAFYRLKLD